MVSKMCAQFRQLADLRFLCSLLITFVALVFIPSSWAQTTESGEVSSSANSLPLMIQNATSETSIEKLLQAYVRNGSSQLFAGTFVYLFEDQLQTIKVFRNINDEGDIVERFVPLDGSERNTIRILQNEYCQLENGWQYQFHAMSSSFPFRVNNYFQHLQKYYDFSLHNSSFPKKEIVAGNQAVRLVVQAKDPYRYGYQLWFEPKTAALLKYKLINHTGKAVEQYLFTDFHLDKQHNESTEVSHTRLPANSKACQQQFSGLKEAFEQYFNKQKMPGGYEAISFRKAFVKDSGRLARQFQLSDGLASVSVFIENVNKTSKKIDGVVKLGPMSVAGKTIGQHQVTVLGAIPIDSALQILAAIRP